MIYDKKRNCMVRRWAAVYRLVALYTISASWHNTNALPDTSITCIVCIIIYNIIAILYYMGHLILSYCNIGIMSRVGGNICEKRK